MEKLCYSMGVHVRHAKKRDKHLVGMSLFGSTLKSAFPSFALVRKNCLLNLTWPRCCVLVFNYFFSETLRIGCICSLVFSVVLNFSVQSICC